MLKQFTDAFISVSVPADKKWGSVPMKALESFPDILTIVESILADVEAPDEDYKECAPFLLKCDDGVVTKVLGPRIGTKDLGGESPELAIQVGDKYYPATDELLEHLVLMAEDGDIKVTYEMEDAGKLIELPIGYYTSEEVERHHLRKLNTEVRMVLTTYASSIEPGKGSGGILNLADFAGKTVGITKIMVRRSNTKDGRSFLSALAAITDENGKQLGLLPLKTGAKRMALALLDGQEGEVPLEEGSTLSIDNGTEKSFNGHPYTSYEMVVRRVNPTIVQICDFY